MHDIFYKVNLLTARVMFETWTLGYEKLLQEVDVLLSGLQDDKIDFNGFSSEFKELILSASELKNFDIIGVLINIKILLYQNVKDKKLAILFAPIDMELTIDKDKISDLIGDTVNLDIQVLRDKSLSDGFRIWFEGKLFDYTPKNILDNIKNQILFNI
jgi:hypothetical protein